MREKSMSAFWGGRGGACAVSAGVVVAGLMLAACGRGVREPAQERVRRAAGGSGDLVVAAAWPWELRQEIRYGEGLQLAVDEVNAGGGINGRRLRLARYDDRETIGEGLLVAQKIAADPDVVAVIGHLQSYVTVQAAAVYSRAGLLLVAPTATDPQLTAAGLKRVFRATFTDGSTGHQLADFAARRGWRKIAICYIRNDYGRNVANAFEARAAQEGLVVQARSSYDPSENVSERTFDQIVSEWKMLEIDAIVVAGEVPSAAILVAQVRRSGIGVPILGSDAMSSPGLMAVAGAAAEGMIVASFFHEAEPRPEIGRFKAAFTRRYGVPPDAGSALGYDCVHLIAQAMRQGPTPAPDDIAAALHASPGWQGVTGAFKFDEAGDLVAKSVTLSVVRNGRFEYVPPAGPSCRPAPAALASGTRPCGTGAACTARDRVPPGSCRDQPFGG
jgi:branched-chain amino acid transport system substrate-binding protein